MVEYAENSVPELSDYSLHLLPFSSHISLLQSSAVQDFSQPRVVHTAEPTLNLQRKKTKRRRLCPMVLKVGFLRETMEMGPAAVVSTNKIILALHLNLQKQVSRTFLGRCQYDS